MDDRTSERPDAMNYLTVSALLKKVTKHLLKQKKRSTNALVLTISGETTNNVCAYRGENGLRCAIGCLISDSRYKPSFEGRLLDRSIMEAARINFDDTYPLAAALQHIHDNYPPSQWRERLKILHADYEIPFKY